MFHGILADDVWRPDDNGEYFFDRGYEGFERVLRYLNTGVLSFDGLNKYENDVLLENLDYFQISFIRWSTANLLGCTFSNGNRTVTSLTEGLTVHASDSAHSFKVHTPNASCGYIGFIATNPLIEWVDSNSHVRYSNVTGWFFHTNGYLYVQHSGILANSGRTGVSFPANSTFGVIHDIEQNQIRIVINGVAVGTCFSVDSSLIKKVTPTVILGTNATATLIIE
jgi:hypothetical protein